MFALMYLIKKNKQGYAERSNFTGRRYVALKVKEMGSRTRERTLGAAANWPTCNYSCRSAGVDRLERSSQTGTKPLIDCSSSHTSTLPEFVQQNLFTANILHRNHLKPLHKLFCGNRNSLGFCFCFLNFEVSWTIWYSALYTWKLIWWKLNLVIAGNMIDQCPKGTCTERVETSTEKHITQRPILFLTHVHWKRIYLDNVWVKCSTFFPGWKVFISSNSMKKKIKSLDLKLIKGHYVK